MKKYFLLQEDDELEEEEFDWGEGGEEGEEEFSEEFENESDEDWDLETEEGEEIE